MNSKATRTTQASGAFRLFGRVVWSIALLLMFLPSAAAVTALLIAEPHALYQAPLTVMLFSGASLYGALELFRAILFRPPVLRPLFTVLILLSAFLLAFIDMPNHLRARHRASAARSRPLMASLLAGFAHRPCHVHRRPAHAKRLEASCRDLLPFVEDNSDYYCLNSRGEVVYWSHNGSTDERWPSIAAWHQQVCINRQ